MFILTKYLSSVLVSHITVKVFQFFVQLCSLRSAGINPHSLTLLIPFFFTHSVEALLLLSNQFKRKQNKN